MRISDWSSDVCSSDLLAVRGARPDILGKGARPVAVITRGEKFRAGGERTAVVEFQRRAAHPFVLADPLRRPAGQDRGPGGQDGGVVIGVGDGLGGVGQPTAQRTIADGKTRGAAVHRKRGLSGTGGYGSKDLDGGRNNTKKKD